MRAKIPWPRIFPVNRYEGRQQGYQEWVWHRGDGTIVFLKNLGAVTGLVKGKRVEWRPSGRVQQCKWPWRDRPGGHWAGCLATKHMQQEWESKKCVPTSCTWGSCATNLSATRLLSQTLASLQVWGGRPQWLTPLTSAPTFPWSPAAESEKWLTNRSASPSLHK